MLKGIKHSKTDQAWPGDSKYSLEARLQAPGGQELNHYFVLGYPSGSNTVADTQPRHLNQRQMLDYDMTHR